MVFEQLALIGCGLMGGSFALAAKKAGLVKHVCGYSRSEKSAQRALALGVVDTVSATAEHCVRGADLVLLAVPVASTEATLRSLLPGLAPHALVMDVGSTKQDVVLAAQAALGERMAQFVPAHPICGKEVAGVEHAVAELYQHQQVILTPLACHSPATLAQASQVWLRLGCKVRELTPAQHDQALAAVSHFPHLMAFAFMRSLMAQPEGEQFLGLGGPGFRDSTRIAAGDADLWSDVLLANSGPVLVQAEKLRRALAELEGLLTRQDRPALHHLIDQVGQRRAAWRMAGDPEFVSNLSTNPPTEQLSGHASSPAHVAHRLS